MVSIASLGFLNSAALAQTTPKEETQPVRIQFAAKVGEQDFSCTLSYALGKGSKSDRSKSFQVADFRFYVSEVALLDRSGKAVPVQLEQDETWQYQNVALLDFENKTDACSNGTPETRNQIIGTVPKGEYRGIQFTLGLPPKLNHEDASIAPSPLNLTGLWWNWQGGYKFLRVDLQASQPQDKPTEHGGAHGKHKHDASSKHSEKHSAGFPIHLGSTGCQDLNSKNRNAASPCQSPNRSIVRLPNFDLQQSQIIVDLASLLDQTDVTQNQAKTPPGCMSSPNDRDCAGIFETLGIPFDGQSPRSQRFFKVVERRDR